MSISNDDYNRYIKPILDNKDLWVNCNVFQDVTITQLAAKMSIDNRMADFQLVLTELVTRRKQLLEDPSNNEILIVDLDKDGNPIGEPRLEKVWGRL